MNEKILAYCFPSQKEHSSRGRNWDRREFESLANRGRHSQKCDRSNRSSHVSSLICFFTFQSDLEEVIHKFEADLLRKLTCIQRRECAPLILSLKRKTWSVSRLKIPTCVSRKSDRLWRRNGRNLQAIPWINYSGHRPNQFIITNQLLHMRDVNNLKLFKILWKKTHWSIFDAWWNFIAWAFNKINLFYDCNFNFKLILHGFSWSSKEFKK